MENNNQFNPQGTNYDETAILNSEPVQPAYEPQPQPINEQPQPEYTYDPVVENNVPQKKSTDVLGIISMIAGILGLLFNCCCGYISYPCCIAGIILAVVSKSKNGGKMSGMAKAGLIISIIVLALSAVLTILSLVFGFGTGFLSALTESINNTNYYY